MKEFWKEIPKTFKKQIIKRLGIGIVFVVIGIITWIISKEFVFAFPCFCGALAFIVRVIVLMRASVYKSYVVLSGVCCELEQTRIAKQTKVVSLDTEYGRVKIPLRKSFRGLRIGASVQCYMSLRAGVYEYDGVKVVCDYYVLEVL